MPDITAIIPTHLRPHLLAEAVACVAAQRLAPSELIVVDDADDARARQVVAQAAAPFPIRYLANPHAGACRSRNLGTEAATTPLIAFLDDDDLWRPDFLARLRTRMADTGAALAVSGLVRHEAGQPPRSRVQMSGLGTATVLRQVGSFTGSNFLIRRDAFLAVGGFDPAMTVFNDWDLFVRLIDRGTDYAVVEDALAEWREHEGERIATPSLRRADGLEHFIARYRDRLAPDLVRDFRTTALGIRRAHARTVGSRLLLSARLALAHGPLGAPRRIARRLLGR